jgi:hypothetical protein
MYPSRNKREENDFVPSVQPTNLSLPSGRQIMGLEVMTQVVEHLPSKVQDSEFKPQY